MKYRFDGFNWLVRLEKGERLMPALQEVTAKEGIKTGWVMGIGAAAWAELGFFDGDKKDYLWKKFDTRLEILALQGSVALLDGKPSFHIHGTFSDNQMRSFGGHVKDLEVAQTCEIFLHGWFKGEVERKFNPDIGLKLLDL